MRDNNPNTGAHAAVALEHRALTALRLFERGDEVFQYSIDVRQTKATVVAMAGAYTTSIAIHENVFNRKNDNFIPD